ncbi:MAG: alpha/beta hydrolase [Candidatus Omnitrophica bacterium]|nr:alpha/beta hydrolase [Candidatus Omnitrophota bacterium]MDD5487893.1 alpha/beta hydrolase [Candidatus Omnitrophota bacterium]
MFYAFLAVFLFSWNNVCGAAMNATRAVKELAGKNGFVEHRIDTPYFTLLSYARVHEKGAPIVIYIEGDGRAWKNRRTVSTDPTPRTPMVFKMMIADGSPNLAYLARPCQYVGGKNYDSGYWTGKRFSEEVIASMSEAVDELKSLSGAKEVKLIGYSGGGAVAVLIAARREDVIGIVTVAGNLDHVAVNKLHRVGQIGGSLNPIDVAGKVADIPQRHFSGDKDNVVPQEVAETFVIRTGDRQLERLDVVEGCGHEKGWTGKWKDLVKRTLI